MRVGITGTCFIQKIYAPSSSLSEEEEGVYIFWMKQVPVVGMPFTAKHYFFINLRVLFGDFFSMIRQIQALPLSPNWSWENVIVTFVLGKYLSWIVFHHTTILVLFLIMWTWKFEKKKWKCHDSQCWYCYQICPNPLMIMKKKDHMKFVNYFNNVVSVFQIFGYI